MNLDKKFSDYDKENPQVFLLFKQFALDAKQKGRLHFGAKAIMERVRWEMNINTTGDHFKINNNYTSRYARKLTNELPSFEGFFHTRTLKSAGAAA